MTKLKDLHRRWSMDADYDAAYDALGEEFQLASALIEARTRAGLTQMQLARRMKTSQSYVARIEGGKVKVDKKEPLKIELEAFLHSVITRERPLVSGEEARAALAET